MLSGLNTVMGSLSENTLPNQTPQTFQSDSLKVSAQKMTAGKFCEDMFTTEKYFFDDSYAKKTSSNDG
jgi:hypothetical protein